MHSLLRYPATIVLSETIGALKSEAASAFLNEFGSQLWGWHEPTLWSNGLFLPRSAVPLPEILRQYIETGS